VSSTKARRQRRRQLRSMKHRLDGEGVETELEHASWLDQSLGRRETAADLGESPRSQPEPLYGADKAGRPRPP
jgi:hypothetical protein